jgi:hypothetical protein
MSRHIAGWGLKHIISIGATIIIGGAVAAPVVVLPIGSAHATASTPGSSSTPTLIFSPDENNWG